MVVLPVVANGACIFMKESCPERIDLMRWSYTNFEYVLNRVNTCFRGKPFCKQTLLYEFNILNDNITALHQQLTGSSTVRDIAKYSTSLI